MQEVNSEDEDEDDFDETGLLLTEVDIGNGIVVEILQDPGCKWCGEPHKDTTGSRLWPGAIALTNYLVGTERDNIVAKIELEEDRVPVKTVQSDWPSTRVLELGAGLGLVGIALACYGASVTLTELRGQLNLLRRNVEINYGNLLRGGCKTYSVNQDTQLQLNHKVRCKAQELDWAHTAMLPAGIEKGSFDVIIGSEICYDDESDPLLISLLTRVCSPATLVFLSLCDHREEREDGFPSDFFKAAHGAGFDCKIVKEGVRDGERTGKRIYVLS